jgi:hypothetical protein
MVVFRRAPAASTLAWQSLRISSTSTSTIDIDIDIDTSIDGVQKMRAAVEPSLIRRAARIGRHE